MSAITGFILPPLIITTYGSSVNGLVSSIVQFIMYLNIVEAGVGAASIAVLYKPLAEKDPFVRNSILSAARKFYNRSGSIFLALVFLLALIFPFITSGQIDRQTTFLMVLVLGLTGTAEFFLIGKYRVLLTADQKMYVLSFAQIIGVILNTLVSIILIKCNFSILFVKFVSSIVYLSRFLIIYLYVKRCYFSLSFHEIPNDRAIAQKWDALIHQIASLVVFNSPVVLITIFCGLKEVSVYTVYALVFTAISQLLSAFSGGLQSFFGESLVLSGKDQIRRQYRKYENIFFSVAGWCYSSASVLIIPFMGVYTNNLNDVNYHRPIIAFLFIFAGIINSFRIPGATLIVAAGHFKNTKHRAILEASINLFVSLLCIRRIGIYAIMFGSLCSTLYRTIDVWFYISKHFVRQTVLVTVGKALFLFGSILVSTYFLINLIPQNVNGYLPWFLESCIVGVALFVFYGCIYLIFKGKK